MRLLLSGLDETNTPLYKTVEEFVLDSEVSWPEFKERLDEMNHRDETGSRSGDVFIMMNSKEGYLTINNAADMLHGWHGGATIAESYVPLKYSMPGGNIMPEGLEFIRDSINETQELINAEYGYDAHFRNWHMPLITKNILMKVRPENVSE